jgi:hypothetical protein
MTAPRLSAYQAFIIAAGELFSVLTAAAASPPPPERFMAAVSDAVATIDRAHSSLVLVASQDALTAAAEVVQRAHRIREFLDPYQRSPHGLGELTQEYASACNAFTRTARDEVGNERSLSAVSTESLCGVSSQRLGALVRSGRPAARLLLPVAIRNGSMASCHGGAGHDTAILRAQPAGMINGHPAGGLRPNRNAR